MKLQGKITLSMAFAALVLAGIAVYRSLPAHTAVSCGMVNCQCSPFGGYCTGAGRGWYGADKAVNSADDASAVIKEVYLPRKISITNIRNETGFFEADVKDSNNKLLDTVIVDKRTGRIRSIY